MCEAVSKYFLKSQSFLLRLTGHSKDSMRVSKSMISNLNTSTKQMNEIERENLIYSHMDNQNYQEAMKVAEEGNGSLLIGTKKL